jgi:hypothetical protein
MNKCRTSSATCRVLIALALAAVSGAVALPLAESSSFDKPGNGGVDATWLNSPLGDAGGAVRDVAVGTKLKGPSDDTIRVLTVMSAGTRRVWLFTDTSSVPDNWLTKPWRLDTVVVTVPSNGFRGAAIGDADNDSTCEILVGRAANAANQNIGLYMAKWNGSAFALTAIDTATSGAAASTMRVGVPDIFVGNADSVAGNEIVYAFDSSTTLGTLRVARYSGGTWTKTRLKDSTELCMGVAVGDWSTVTNGVEIASCWTDAANNSMLGRSFYNGSSWLWYSWNPATSNLYDICCADFDPTNSGAELAVVNGGAAGARGIYEVTFSGNTPTVTARYTSAVAWGLDGEIAAGHFWSVDAASVAAASGSVAETRCVTYNSGAWTSEVAATSATNAFGVAIGKVNKWRTWDGTDAAMLEIASTGTQVTRESEEAGRPSAPILISPANGSVVTLPVTLSWRPAYAALNYLIYLNSSLIDSTTGTSCAPAGITPGTAYTWRIVAKNSYGTTTSSTWSFTALNLDAQAQAIIVPTGTVTRGSVITPQARVKNNGNSTQTFDVRFDISDGYQSTVTVTSLAAGDTARVTFGDWTASTNGTFTTKCSTRLTGDNNTTNDLVTGSVTVVTHDVGCTKIIAPTGTVLLGANLTPACSVYNYGSVSEGYTVRMKIGSGYNSTATVSGHSSGARLYVTFPTWTAGTLGTLAVTCTTELSGDVTPSNDRQTGTVTVVSHDVGCTRIIVPTGTVLLGANLTPACSVYNYGSVSEGYTVRMRIGSGYNLTATVSGHSSGTRLYVTFPAWTAGPVGTLAVTCTTELTGDMTASNDRQTGTVTVIAHDVGCTDITAPTGTVLFGANITPACSVYNYGSVSEGYTVRMKIGSGYNSTAAVSGHTAGTRLYVTFPTWSAGPSGTLAVTCTTELTGDMTTSNDRQTGTVDVQSLVHDIGCTRLIAPAGPFDSGATATPACSVYNYGNQVETSVNVRMKIGAGYNATATIASLAAGTRVYVTFASWTALTRGSNAVTCSTELSGDDSPDNDLRSGTAVVAVHDIAAVTIDAPTGGIPSGPVTPEATVHNSGTVREACSVTFTIPGTGYSQTLPLAAGLPFADTVLAFTDWSATTGSYTTRCSTYLANDQVRANNVVTGEFSVGMVDVGVSAILAPVNSIDTSVSITPQALVRNFGDVAVTFPVTFTIDAWTDAKTVTSLAAHDSVAVTFAVWPKPHALGPHATRCSTYIAFDANTLNNVKTGSFTITVPAPDTGWTRKADVPAGAKGKKVKDGGCLAYRPGTADTGIVYALKGNGRYEFYNYNTAANIWAVSDSIPAIGRTGKKKAVKRGAAMTSIQGQVYATKGNSSLEFWCYYPDSTPGKRWAQLADVTLGAKAIKEGAGMVALTLGDSDFVYLLKGSGTQEFLRYNTGTNTWAGKASAPAGVSGKPFKDGSSISLSGDGRTIFAVKAGYNEFYSYNVDSNTWATLTAIPFAGRSGRKTKIKSGSGSASGNGYVYVIKGGNSQEAWKYQVDSSKWTQLSDVPLGGGKKVKGGGALVYSPTPTPCLFALKGNNTTEFWKYHLRTYVGLDNSGDANVLSSFTAGAANLTLRAFPNPFSDATTISYSLPRAGNVNLRLYDVTGKFVSTLASGFHPAGTSASVVQRSTLSTGIYLLKLEVGTTTTTAKLIIE